MTANVSSRQMRPSERVLHFLESGAFSSQDSQIEVRLPSIRQVAAHLNVSVSTVVTVYKELSSSNRIRTEVGNGSFLLPKVQEGKPKGTLRIATNLSTSLLSESEGWHHRVFGGIMIAAMKSGESISLHPMDNVSSRKETEQYLSDYDALLMLPGGYLSPEDVTDIAIPTVFLNPPHDGATENFVSADYCNSSKLLGEALRKAKKKRVLFLMNDAAHRSISNHLRLTGLLTGLQLGSDRSVEFFIEFAEHPSGTVEGKKALQRFIKQRNIVPDAIYAIGDFLALGCVEELFRRGIPCPDQVSVCGGSGLNLDRESHPQLTRTKHPFEEIGNELTNMVRKLIRNPDNALPGRIVPMTWLGGATSSELENEILFPVGSN